MRTAPARSAARWPVRWSARGRRREYSLQRLSLRVYVSASFVLHLPVRAGKLAKPTRHRCRHSDSAYHGRCRAERSGAGNRAISAQERRTRLSWAEILGFVSPPHGGFTLLSVVTGACADLVGRSL